MMGSEYDWTRKMTPDEIRAGHSFPDAREVLDEDPVQKLKDAIAESKLSAATKARYDKPQPYRGVIARFPRAILALAEVSAYGTKKHELPLDDKSYLEVPDAEYMFVEAELRHMLKEAINGPYDGDGDQLAHKLEKAWNALADVEVFLRSHPLRESPADWKMVKPAQSLEEVEAGFTDEDQHLADTISSLASSTEPYSAVKKLNEAAHRAQKLAEEQEVKRDASVLRKALSID